MPNPTPASFGYTGAPMNVTVLQTGIYDILAFGAQGGTGYGGDGHQGAEIGDVTLTAGEILTIAVGGQASSGGGSGNEGGGSFDADPTGIFSLATAGGNGSATITELPPTPVPEPASLALLCTGLLDLGLIRRRRNAR